MTELLLFIFGTIGLTHIIVDSSIMEWPRNFFIKYVPFIGKMMSCYQCCGFWSGIICGYLAFLKYGLWGGSSINLFHVLLCGFAGSFLSTFAASYLVYLESLSFMSNPPEEK